MYMRLKQNILFDSFVMKLTNGSHKCVKPVDIFVYYAHFDTKVNLITLCIKCIVHLVGC